jgi:beta-glucuronidase
VREFDPTRPVCFANVATAPPEADVVTSLFDLICLNRYYGWYVETGDLETAEHDLEAELRAWAGHGKPILVTEFGADAMPGLHAVPARNHKGVFTRDRQPKAAARLLRALWNPHCGRSAGERR